MFELSLFQFGKQLQDSNPNSLVSISWEINEGFDQHPSFLFFDNVAEVLAYFQKIASGYRVIDGEKEEWFTKAEPLMIIEDNVIKLIQYKYEGNGYAFFDKIRFQELSKLLEQNSSPEIN